MLIFNIFASLNLLLGAQLSTYSINYTISTRQSKKGQSMQLSYLDSDGRKIHEMIHSSDEDRLRDIIFGG